MLLVSEKWRANRNVFTHSMNFFLSGLYVRRGTENASMMFRIWSLEETRTPVSVVTRTLAFVVAVVSLEIETDS